MTKSGMWISVSASALAVAMTALPTGALAQTQGTSLEEIVVTAQRREENIQTVPIAVTAVTAMALAKAGVTGPDTLAQVVPGLNLNRAGGKTIQPYIRAVGTTGSSTGFESPVALYVDGVYYADLQGAQFQFNNIERVEVLKGPQGTLFGRNATGGLISVTTREPVTTPGVEASISYGNYKTTEGSAYITGGKGNVAADLAIYFLGQKEGFGESLTLGGRANWRNEIGARSKLVWRPSDDDKVTLGADFYSSKGDYGITSGPFPGVRAVGGTVTPANIFDRQGNYRASVPVSDNRTVSAKYEHQFSWGSLQSISAWRRNRTDYNIDQDTGPLAAANTLSPSYTRTLQQEILLTGDYGRLHWTTGVFLLDHRAAYIGIRVRSGLAAASNTDIHSQQDTISYAGYGEGTFAITDMTRLTAGFRYTVDKRDFAGYVNGGPGHPSGQGTILLQGRGEQTAKSPSWRLGIDHRFNDDVMVYGSYNRGFKSGSFNLTALTAPPLRPEKIDAFEVGMKSELLNNTLRVNAAAFYYNYSDIQLSRVVIGGQQLFNAAKGRMKGGEIEATYAPPIETGNLTITAGLSVLDAKYRDFPNGPVAVQPPPAAGGTAFVVCSASPANAALCDLSGRDMTKAPEYTFSLRGAYSVPVGENEVGISASYFHTAKFYWDPENRLVEPSYDLVNAAAYFAFGRDNNLRINVFGNNLGNKRYFNYAATSGTGDNMTPGLPRTYGVGVSLKY